MEAKERSFSFMKAQSYYDIPFFQREYVWSEENWSELLDNFFDYSDSHFLGSIILKQERTRAGDASRYIIIDGQQRLTTLSILVRACYDRLLEEADLYDERVVEGFKTTLQQLLFIIPDDFSVQQDVKIHHSKLDAPAYQAVINGDYATEGDPSNRQGGEKKEYKSRIVNCYFYFREELHNRDEEDIKKLWKLLTNSATAPYLVNIDLDAEENEQKIFDTVNNFGVHLSSSDTIKNSVFQKYIERLRLEDDPDPDGRATSLYDKTWHAAFSEDEESSAYWNSIRRYGRLTRDNLEVLLYAYAVINGFFDPSEDNIVSLPQKYKKHISDITSQELERFLQDIYDYSSVFRNSFIPMNDEQFFGFENFRQRLLQICHSLDVATFYPYILKALYQNEVTNKMTDEMLKSRFLQLERYIILNAVCGGSTKNYNNECVQLVRERRTPEDLQSSCAAINRVAFEDGLRRMKTNKVPTVLLFWIELYNRSRAESFTDMRELKFTYTLEHVMPQKWQRNWSVEELPVYEDDGEIVSDVRDAVEERSRAVYMLGNMTLLNSKLNTSVSNSSFRDKVDGSNSRNRRGMKDYADLLMTREIINKSAWDERDIRQRTRDLQTQIESIWSIVFPEDAPIIADIDMNDLSASYESLFENSEYRQILNSISRVDTTEDVKARFYELLSEDIYNDIAQGVVEYEIDGGFLDKETRSVLKDLQVPSALLMEELLLAADSGNKEKALSIIRDELNEHIIENDSRVSEELFIKLILNPIKNSLPSFYKSFAGMELGYDLDPVVTKVCENLDEYFEASTLEDAELPLVRIKEGCPDSIVANTLLGHTYYEEGRWDKSVECFEACKDLDYWCLLSQDTIFFDLGYAYSKLKDSQRSIAYYKKSIELCPQEAMAHNNLGYEYYLEKDYESALKCYKECLSYNPSNAYASNYIVRVLVALDRLDEAKYFVENSPRKLRKDTIRILEDAGVTLMD